MNQEDCLPSIEYHSANNIPLALVVRNLFFLFDIRHINREYCSPRSAPCTAIDNLSLWHPELHGKSG